VLSRSQAHTINNNITSSCTQPSSQPASNNSKPTFSQSTRATHNSNSNSNINSHRNSAHNLPPIDLSSSNMDTNQSLLLPAAQARLHPISIHHRRYNMVDLPTT
jgi:hypothetical protein